LTAGMSSRPRHSGGFTSARADCVTTVRQARRSGAGLTGRRSPSQLPVHAAAIPARSGTTRAQLPEYWPLPRPERSLVHEQQSRRVSDREGAECSHLWYTVRLVRELNIIGDVTVTTPRAAGLDTRPPKPTIDLQLAVLTGRLVWPLDVEVAHPETASLGQAKKSPSAVC
jgi:hypothetical protein